MKRSNPSGGGGGGKRAATGGGTSTGQGLTTTDALTYLKEVKERFANQREVYEQFLEVMKEFKAQTLDTHGVTIKVKQLFKGHPELVMGFNMFLPAGYKMEHPHQGPATAPQKTTVQKPRPAVAKDPQRWKDSGASAAGSKKRPAEEKKAQGKPAPQEKQEDKNKQPVEFDQAINYVNKIKKRFSGDERVYKAFLEILNQYRKGQQSIGQVYERVSILFQDQRDLLEEFTYFLPDTTQQKPAARPGAAAQRPTNRPVPKTRPPAGPSGRAPTPALPAEDGALAGGRPGTRQATRNRQTGSEEGTGGRGNTLGNGLGRGVQSAPKACLAKELRFFGRMKMKLRNRDVHSDLLRCMAMFSNDLISKQELEALASGILTHHPDLLQGFFDFVDNASHMDFGYEEGKDPKRDETLTPKEKATLRECSRREKYMTMPISELDLNNMEHCSTSYRHLPPDYPKLNISGRSALQRSVLNDHWVSVVTGSEDYSFKFMRKNQYEDSLFRCEDERYELDMVIQSNLSALRALTKIAERLEAMPQAERETASLQPGELKALQRRAIERLYGDPAPQVLELLDTYPAGCVETILARLLQKNEEFERVKADMQMHWQKQYDANYINSLDHRSFYFKQSDRKHLSVKALVTDMKELAGARASAVESLNTIPPGVQSYLQSLTQPPDMELKYSDSATHGECYRLLLCATSAYLGPVARGRVMDFWHMFIEPLLGCPQHGGNAAEGNAQATVKPEPDDGRTQGNGVAEGSAGQAAGRELDRATPEPETEASSGASGKEDEEGEREVKRKVKAEAGNEDEGENEEDEEADSEERDSSGRFAGCRPLRSACMDWEYPAPESASLPTSDSVLYCNDSLFFVLRIHELLYSRLQVAKRSCHEGRRKRFNPHGKKEAAKTEDEIAQERQRAKETHERFLTAVELLVRNKMDSSTFEDEMRPLLGANAYVTFTLDKLLQKLVKQLQALTQEPTIQRLQAMERYEGRRRPQAKAGSPTAVAMADAVCCANTVMQLQGEECFRVAISYGKPRLRKGADPQAPPSSRDVTFRVSLVDKPSQFTSSIGQPPPADFQEFFNGSMDTEEVNDDIPEFLARGLARAMGRRVTKVSELPEAGKDCQVRNGLEIKVACVKPKISYVLGTEDVFIRRRRLRKGGQAADLVKERLTKRSSSFNVWLSRAAEEASGDEQEEEEEEEDDEDEEDLDDDDGTGTKEEPVEARRRRHSRRIML
mmetsp:Transcript_30010/g.84673  ORF Transcript_30010/g.84673 Transcript_30010/m.84673 type:complete len:1227 (-) Transcript_30010:31-3711(-)